MIKYDPYKHGVSQGLLTTFMRCRTEAKYWMLGLEQIRSGSAMQFGSIAHRVLELIYGKCTKAPKEDQVLEVLMQVYKEFRKIEGKKMSGEGLENLETNYAILQAVLPEYFKFYKAEFGDAKWVELEKVFNVPSPSAKINLVGRIDGAFRRKKELWLFESKTKGRIEEDTMGDALTFDFQTNVYQYVLEQKYKQVPDGVLYNVIRRPMQRLKQSEKLTAFRDRIRVEIQKQPEHYFLRYEISVPPTEAARFRKELTDVLGEFKKWIDGELATYRNTSACMQKYGACRFLPICASGDRGLYRTREHVFPELVD